MPARPALAWPQGGFATDDKVDDCGGVNPPEVLFVAGSPGVHPQKFRDFGLAAESY
jgi:hypothetical protein